MFFAKITVVSGSRALFDKNAEPQTLSKAEKKYAQLIEDFSMRNRQESYFFLIAARYDSLEIGMISVLRNCGEKRFGELVSRLNIENPDVTTEEITCAQISRFISIADRRNYISEDGDDIFDRLNIPYYLHGRFSFDVGENLIPIMHRQEMEKQADEILFADTLIPEIERIYTPNTKKCKSFIQPVHYTVQTEIDNKQGRKQACRILLSALYANGRLRNSRYAYVDINLNEHYRLSDLDSLYGCYSEGAIILRFHASRGLSEQDEFGDCGLELLQRILNVVKEYHRDVLTVLCFSTKNEKTERLINEMLPGLTLVKLKEEKISGKLAEKYLSDRAYREKLHPNKKLLSQVCDDKEYTCMELDVLFDTWFSHRVKETVFTQYLNFDTGMRIAAKQEPKSKAYDELAQMIGLDEAKKVITQAIRYFKAQRLFRDRGVFADRPSMSMVFTGNPGSAKTTVARLVARILKDEGILKDSNLIEAGRGDIVGKYVGHTAPNVIDLFKRASGSVLFIDEAYSLVDDRDGLFGDEAINTIVQEMENRRDDVLVIFAGYPDKMEAFLCKNPGLRSRIAFHVPFADYSCDQLCDITTLMAKKKGLTVSEDAMAKLSDIYKEANTHADFGNGRFVRSILEQSGMNLASRLLDMDVTQLTDRDITTITAADITVPNIVRQADVAMPAIGFGT